jgi:CDP-diacylglycerol--glycerol-3-phosphate 3-phosphatidyltransferase
MNGIPVVLIYSRLLLGAIIVLLGFKRIDHYSFYITILFAIGLLTDIFDGIIARRLNVSTPALRRLDSSVDQVFFISTAVAVYILCPEFFKTNAFQLIILIGAECLTYLICFIKFRKEIATHSIGAKIWTLILFATLIQIIWQCQSVVLFAFCFWVGLITRVEIIAIILTLKGWANDVPTFYHALQLRAGKQITRHRWFNG